MFRTYVLALFVACNVVRFTHADIHHANFQDFAAGTPGDSGSNVYVARSGAVEVINQFDFDGDGTLDIYLLEDHNVIENADVFVYLGSADGPQSILPPSPEDQPLYHLLEEYERRHERVVRLPSDGGGRSLLADLNRDGYDELVFCNYIHNYSVHTNVFIYWNGPKGFHRSRRTELPSLMGNGIALADFNGDNFPDLAVTNGGIESANRWGSHLNRETYIYWNSPKGFSIGRRSVLPCNSPVACAAGDLDGDGFPDLAIANNNAKEKCIYVYWGSEDGLSATRRSSVDGGEPIGIAVADLDGDARQDWVILHEDGAELRDISDRNLGFSWRHKLPSNGAAECSVADFNRDGQPDIVFAGLASNAESQIYYGSSIGFPEQPSLVLPTRHAAGVACADFNRDGWTDLLFANQDDGSTSDISSYLYWNGPEGFDASHRRLLQGFGPVSAAAGDLDHDGHTDAVLVNRYSGVKGATNLGKVFWGNPKHHYGPDARVTRLEAGHTAAAAAADINHDGRIDLATGAGNFYLGGPNGLGESGQMKVEVGQDRGGQFADLNRDGFLDYVTVWGIASLIEERERIFAIYWGSADGFRDDNRLAIPVGLHVPCISPIADLNRDGNLDIVLTDMDTPYVEIYWGALGGEYTAKNKQRLRCSQGLGAEIADLDSDGWLDFVVGGGWDYTDMGLPTDQLNIAWGGPDGFLETNVTALEAYNANELCIADLDKDGHLDLITSNYHGETTRSIPVFIYWGAPGRTFSEGRRTELPAESSSHVAAADFNQDSWPDVLVSNHIENGRHTAGSHIYWGGPDGFTTKRRTWFQSFGVHIGMPRDLGNIATRMLEEEYVSAPLTWAPDDTPARLSWKASTPPGSALRF